jgi:hypothetical protein
LNRKDGIVYMERDAISTQTNNEDVEGVEDDFVIV